MDDVLIPVLNLFGPVVLILSAALIILPLWGFNITSVLVGAGVIGLVLGLALQSTLANIFSGLSLLVEAPFRTGDLITLSDGRICEVQRVGMRSTQLYSVKEHATVFVPNTTFSTTTLTNITKPTVDQKFSLEFKAPANIQLETFMQDVRKIALAHPATLASNMNEKVELLKLMLGEARQKQSRSNQLSTRNIKEIGQVEQVIPKLELEGSLNATLIQLEEALRNLIRGIKAREIKGLTETERQEIFCNYISPVDPVLQETISLAKSWASSVDPWLDHTDHWDLVRLWDFRNSQLQEQWERVKKAIYHPNDRTEMRLDDLTSELVDWIQREYKIIPEYWKDPTVFVKGMNGAEVLLQVSYYVDNIRLEHDERANRVQSEITYQIHQLIQKYG